MGTIVGAIKGDTRSLDDSSYTRVVSVIPTCKVSTEQ